MAFHASILSLLVLQASSFVAPQSAVCKTTMAKPVVRPAVALAVAESVKWVVAAPALYGLMSVNEYFTHRYYQVGVGSKMHVFECTQLINFNFVQTHSKHAEYNKDNFFQWLAATFNLPKKIRGGGHVEHHAETYDDMLLKTDDEKWMTSPAAKSLNSVNPVLGGARSRFGVILKNRFFVLFSFPDLTGPVAWNCFHVASDGHHDLTNAPNDAAALHGCPPFFARADCFHAASGNAPARSG
jgi:hypothetical protein